MLVIDNARSRFPAVLITILSAAVITSSVGCGPSKRDQGEVFVSKGAAPASELTVEQVQANPKAYAHALITIHGCYVQGFEISILQACHNRRSGEEIWVEDARDILLDQELQKKGFSASKQPSLLFHYDQENTEREWKKLEATSGKEFGVTLIGQFETDDARGFGHLGVYKHELILMDVLDGKPVDTDKPRKEPPKK